MSHAVEPIVKLVNAEELIQYPPERVMGEFAAICYDTNTSKVNPVRIATNCIDHGHGSPQRCVQFLFHIEGVSRALSHQWVRHNVGVSHNQRSQRYVKEAGFNFIKPVKLNDVEVPVMIKGERFVLSYEDVMEVDRQWYAGALTQEVPGEDARFVLPNGCETQVNTAFTFQALDHFMRERLCRRAQWEIRIVAELMLQEVQLVSPVLAKRLGPNCFHDGFCRQDPKETCGRAPLKADMLNTYYKAHPERYVPVELEYQK